jgi:hypothetical protein
MARNATPPERPTLVPDPEEVSPSSPRSIGDPSRTDTGDRMTLTPMKLALNDEIVRLLESMRTDGEMLDDVVYRILDGLVFDSIGRTAPTPEVVWHDAEEDPPDDWEAWVWAPDVCAQVFLARWHPSARRWQGTSSGPLDPNWAPLAWAEITPQTPPPPPRLERKWVAG